MMKVWSWLRLCVLSLDGDSAVKILVINISLFLDGLKMDELFPAHNDYATLEKPHFLFVDPDVNLHIVPVSSFELIFRRARILMKFRLGRTRKL